MLLIHTIQSRRLITLSCSIDYLHHEKLKPVLSVQSRAGGAVSGWGWQQQQQSLVLLWAQSAVREEWELGASWGVGESHHWTGDFHPRHVRPINFLSLSSFFEEYGMYDVLMVSEFQQTDFWLDWCIELLLFYSWTRTGSGLVRQRYPNGFMFNNILDCPT